MIYEKYVKLLLNFNLLASPDHLITWLTFIYPNAGSIKNTVVC